MTQEAIYGQHARFYDLLYSYKDYKQEAKEITQIAQKFKSSTGNSLLEVGCGTGRHLQHLQECFECTGVDMNAGMLDIARTNSPNIPFFEQDMSQLKLGQQFDVVSSLFSSIGYVTEHDALKATFAAMASHLKPGGVLLIEPWIEPQNFSPGNIHMTTYEKEDIKIARMGVSSIEGNLSVMDMHYMVAEKGKDVLKWVDRNVLAMYKHEELLQMLVEVGIDTHIVHPAFTARGLIVGLK